MKPSKTFTFISLCGCTVFVAIVCLLHFLRPDKNRLTCFVSEYAVGNYGWLMTIGFYTLALAAAMLLIGLLQDCKVSATGCVTLGIFSAGILLAGIFPTDLPGNPPTTRGLIHGFAALIALLNLGISMIAWGIVFKKNANWKSFSKPSIFYGVLSLVLLIIFVGSPISFRGLTQRILLAWDISWLLLVSWKLYHNITGVAISSNTNQ
jgi:hypothetical membrane protein